MMAEDKKEFWRWKEYNWHDENKNPKTADTITAGVDVGSVSSQAVIMLDGASGGGGGAAKGQEDAYGDLPNPGPRSDMDDEIPF